MLIYGIACAPEDLLGGSNGGGGGNRTRSTKWSLCSWNNEIILVLKKL